MSTSAERQGPRSGRKGSEPRRGEGRRGATTGVVSCLQGALSPPLQMPLLNVRGFFGGSIPSSSWESLKPQG